MNEVKIKKFLKNNTNIKQTLFKRKAKIIDDDSSEEEIVVQKNTNLTNVKEIKEENNTNSKMENKECKEIITDPIDKKDNNEPNGKKIEIANIEKKHMDINKIRSLIHIKNPSTSTGIFK